MTLEQDLARFLALAVYNFGGSWTISQDVLDNMLPTRLVLDTTSEPGYVTLAVISNDVIELVVEKADDRDTESLLDNTLQQDSSCGNLVQGQGSQGL